MNDNISNEEVIHKSKQGHRYIKRPEFGQIVKVYCGNKTTKAGRVVGHTMVIEEVSGIEEETQIKTITTSDHEMVVLKPTSKLLNLNEYDFYLEEKAIRWTN